MRHSCWKLLVAALVLVTSGIAIGQSAGTEAQEAGPDVDDILGEVDDNLVGVWEATDEDYRSVLQLRPDGIAILNEYEEGYLAYASICRYGVSDGHVAFGESTDIDFYEGAWEKDGFDEAFKAALPYDITDTTLTFHDPEDAALPHAVTTIWTKSNEQIRVPDEVVLFDGYTSVETHGWGWVKAILDR